jgi:polyketide synthase PksN
VHIGLYPQADGRIAYEVYTKAETNGAEPMAHCQGAAALVKGKTAASLDLGALKARMNRPKLAPGQCYDAFKTMGLAYGKAFQAIESLLIGQGEVLAKVSLPDYVKETKRAYGLHPSLMDAALQASIGLYDASNSRPALPFALERLTILGPINESLWAWVRYSKNGSTSDRFQKLDIDLCDEAGNVWVQLKGFSSRVLEEERSEPQEMGRLLLKPVWKERAAADDRPKIDYKERHVLLCGFKGMVDDLSKKMPRAGVMAVQSQAGALEKCFFDAALQLFEIIQRILKQKPTGPVLIQVLTVSQGPGQVYTALSGLLKTAHLENPKIFGQVIAVEPDLSVESIYAKLEENRFERQSAQIRYVQNKRFVAGLTRLAKTAAAPQSPLERGRRLFDYRRTRRFGGDLRPNHR